MRATAAALLVLLSLVSPGVATQGADQPSFDCRRAATAVEKAICADPELARDDSVLAQLYRDARHHLTEANATKLAANQRSWLTDRNRRCGAGEHVCLANAYRERLDAFRALLAQASDSNPDLGGDEPAALAGDWVVEPFDSAGTTAGRTPLSLEVPPEGARMRAEIGKLCITAPEDARKCAAFGVAAQLVEKALSPQSRARFGNESRMPFLLTYFGGKAEFGLLPRQDGTLIAIFPACDEKGDNCTEQYERWRPTSGDAKIRIFHLF
jgi:uncharacterized protein YecT (DUF1311 family)